MFKLGSNKFIKIEKLNSEIYYPDYYNDEEIDIAYSNFKAPKINDKIIRKYFENKFLILKDNKRIFKVPKNYLKIIRYKELLTSIEEKELLNLPDLLTGYELTYDNPEFYELPKLLKKYYSDKDCVRLLCDYKENKIMSMITDIVRGNQKGYYKKEIVLPKFAINLDHIEDCIKFIHESHYFSIKLNVVEKAMHDKEINGYRLNMVTKDECSSLVYLGYGINDRDRLKEKDDMNVLLIKKDNDAIGLLEFNNEKIISLFELDEKIDIEFEDLRRLYDFRDP